MKKIAIIAALEREVAPLTSGCLRTEIVSQNRRVKIYDCEQAIIAVAGIGTMNARVAAGAAYAHAKGEIARFISAGLAGALVPELEVGDLVIPAEVVDDVDGGKISTTSGEGILVTASSIAGAPAKRAMANRHIARAVDMEAYAVADVARIYGVPFTAIKAISDVLDFPMPPLSRFVSDSGQFRVAGFAFYAAMRPWLWPSVVALSRNSALATDRLCSRLRHAIQEHAPDLYNSGQPVSQAGS